MRPLGAAHPRCDQVGEEEGGAVSKQSGEGGGGGKEEEVEGPGGLRAAHDTGSRQAASSSESSLGDADSCAKLLTGQ